MFLRTSVLPEAVRRSADLLAALEAGERNMIAELSNAPIGAAQTKAVIREHLRLAVARMLARQEAPFNDADGNVYLAKLEERKAEVIAAQRSRDWSLATEIGADLAARVGVKTETLAPAALPPAAAWLLSPRACSASWS